MMDEERVVRNQWIIIALIFIVLALNVVFVFIGRLFPAGEFKASTLNMTECSASGMKIVGAGETRESALAGLELKQQDYAHLYCNGKFRDDPIDVSIPGLGCMVCKPDCAPRVEELTGVSFADSEYGVEASRQVTVSCL
ncbi:MAG: hypothetical protein ABH834_02740 [Candidatus Altiarchaeota archaeon]